MTSEVEERIHKALAGHALERIEHGYRLVHPQGAGVSSLRLLPVNGTAEGAPVVSIAEIVAEYNTAGLPSFHTTGIQRLNSWAVHGAYHVDSGRLRQTAQMSIYSNEPAVHLTVQGVLDAFGGQLPLGLSTALAVTSAAVLKQQRAHHARPHQWKTPVDEESMKAGSDMLRQRGLAAANNATCLWAELPLSGDCPSRSIDPLAETALLQVNAGTPHPIAGVGYLATMSLPLTEVPANSAEICARLNALELQECDFVPRLGAWGLHAPNDAPGYSCFIPSTEALGGMHMTMMWWLIRRAAWVRDRFWAAKAGLQLDPRRDTAHSSS
ncbi:MAG TPA: hypothetical protein VKG63_09970 [Steroidobacteraceae bacterium]|nr:hypothetical protein [Steroidobacteraceae bacterium]